MGAVTSCTVNRTQGLVSEASARPTGAPRAVSLSTCPVAGRGRKLRRSVNPAPHAALVQQVFLVGLPSAGPCASARPKGVRGMVGRERCGLLGRGGGLCVEEGSPQSGLPLGHSLSPRVSPSLTLLSPGREALADPEVWAHETDPSLGWTEVSGLVPTPARCDTGSAERPPQAGQQGRGDFRSPLDLLWLSILGPHSCHLGSLGNTAIWVP